MSDDRYSNETMYPDNPELNELWRERQRAQDAWMAANERAQKLSNRLGPLGPTDRVPKVTLEELEDAGSVDRLYAHYQELDARYTATRDAYLQRQYPEQRR